MKSFLNRNLIFPSLILLLGASMVAKAQVSVSATAGTATGSYTNLNAAFTEINAGTHQGVISITITANTTEPATPIPLLKSGTGSANFSRIVIRPSGNRIINSATSPVTNRSIIELAGADNVTIDGDDPSTAGDRNLTIQCVSSTTTGVGCVRLSSNSTSGADGADNDTVMNCIVIGPRSSGTVTTINYGIRFSNGVTASTTGAYKSLNTVIMNNEIKRCYYGIYAIGASSSYLNTGTKILNNIVGSSVSNDNIGGRGVYLTYTSNNSTASSGNAEIIGNEVMVGNYTTGYSLTLSGIELSSYTAGTKILQNNIHDINQASTSNSYGVYGISIISSSNTNNIVIANNFIRDIRNGNAQSAIPTTGITAGIYISSGGLNYILNHNTIVMNPQISTSTTKSSACLTMATNVTFAQILNNIFINKHSSSNAYAVYSTANSNLIAGEINNNNYYVSYTNAKVGFYNSGARQSLLNWQLGTLKDHLSVSESTTFSSTTDLHIPAGTYSLCESGGASASTTTISKDYDNDARPGSSTYGFGTKPDIGADEFNGRVNYTCSTPSPGSTNVSPSNICVGDSVKLSMSSAISGTGITYQWQFSNDGTSYLDIPGAYFTEWSLVPTGYTYYRCKVTCVNGPIIAFSTPAQVSFNHNITSTTPGQRCGTGSVNLSATGSTGTTLKWYAAYTGGSALGTGSSFATPTIASTTDFYVAAEVISVGTKPMNRTGVYDAVYSWEGISPLVGYYLSNKIQYIIPASYLTNAGFTAGNINSLSFFVEYNSSYDAFENFTIKMANTTSSELSGGFISPTFTTVYGPADHYTSYGVNSFSFASSFSWDGTSNVAIQMCYDNTSSGNFPGDVDGIRVIYTPDVQAYGTYTDDFDLCSNTYGDWDYYEYSLPLFTFNGNVVCVSPRKPVTASINPLPSALISPSSGPVNICELQTKTFSTSSPGTYQWRNTSGLISGATSSTYTTGTAGAYRVIVTNPSTGCKDSSVAITLNINPRPAVSIAPVGTTSICTDSSILLTSTYTGSGLTFKWYKDNTLISGAIEDSIRVSTNGDYTLEAISSTCADTSNISTLNLIPLPSSNFLISDTISAICAGRPVELEALSVPAGYTYQWLLNGVLIPSATNQKHYAAIPGDYTVRITDNNNCRKNSDSINIKVSTLGIPSISPNEANICEGTNIMLHGSGGVYAVYYEWRNSGILLPDTVANVVVNSPGVYSITVKDIYNCIAKSTTSIINVYPLPSKPTIIESSATLRTSLPYSTYQWYRNNKAIVGGNTRSISISYDGDYFVKVTNPQDCSINSDTIMINNLSIDKSNTKQHIVIKIYPNPASSIINIDAPIAVNVYLRDMQGRNLEYIEDAKQVNLEPYADGIYTISIVDKNGEMLQMNKVVKQSN